MDNYKILLGEAEKATGLNDFGNDSFLEGLQILTRALDEEANLNSMGEHFLRERILMHLRQRLQIEEHYRCFPETEQITINKPLIGISLPRTGSTALTFLLAQDSNARSLRRSEAYEPCPPPALRTDNFKLNTEAAIRRKFGLKPHVPTTEDSPAECQDLMSLDFKSQIFLAFAQVPSYADWLFNADLSSTYEYQRRVLKLLQWRMPNQPWRLKCPTHLLYLQYLDKAFPDARFVMTHRDPTDVMLSVSAVYVDIASKFTEQVDRQYLADLNILQWSEGMKRAITFRDSGNDHRFFDIHFLAMQKDPVAEVIKLYRWLGEPMSEEFEVGMQQWWRQNSSTREPSPAVSAGEFGIDVNTLRPLFADYVERMERNFTVGDTM